MTVLPVLEWRSDYIRLEYLTITRTGLDSTTECVDVAELPGGFRALWLRSRYTAVGVAKHSAGAVRVDTVRADFAAQDDYEDVHGANELCRYLTLAPACYEELRLFASDNESMLRIAADWYEPPDNEWDGDTVEQRYEDLQALAAALRRVAASTA